MLFVCIIWIVFFLVLNKSNILTCLLDFYSLFTNVHFKQLNKVVDDINNLNSSQSHLSGNLSYSPREHWVVNGRFYDATPMFQERLVPTCSFHFNMLVTWSFSWYIAPEMFRFSSILQHSIYSDFMAYCQIAIVCETCCIKHTWLKKKLYQVLEIYPHPYIYSSVTSK